MARIDYYFTPLSVFTYLAGDGLEKIAARHGAEVVYKPVNLMQIFQLTGTPGLADRHPSKKAYRLADIRRLAAASGLPLTEQPRHFPTNPVPASAAIIAAQTAGGDVGALAQALMRKLWAEEEDIAQDAVVRACLEEAGFAPDLADKGLLTAVETYERNTNEALDAGVFGSPTYVLDGEVFWGQDRLPLLDRALGL